MIEGRKNIISIAFDGIHRAGKGTQIELLQKELIKNGVPSVSIRGEGYRTGTGDATNNPKSDFWLKMSQKLEEGGNLGLWDEASYRLARELVVWRDRILSGEIDKTLSPFGVLLVDRSFVSKSVLKNLQLKKLMPKEKVFSSEELYPELIQKHKKITADMVLPDIIFELVAPKQVLLSRLDPKDPYYNFRKKNIEESYDLYLEAKKSLPEKIRNIIVTIDSSLKPEEVNSMVIEKIKNRFPELKLE